MGMNRTIGVGRHTSVIPEAPGLEPWGVVTNSYSMGYPALLLYGNPQYTFIHQLLQACFDQRVLPITLWMVRQTI